MEQASPNPSQNQTYSLSSTPTLSELFKALSKAQSVMRPAVLDMTNPFFNNSKYASLTSCQDAYRAPLAENGLCIIQQVFSANGKHWMRSTLAHISGEWISNIMELIVDKNSMQGLGSAITYARRYGVNALIGVVDTEDDDGNGATQAAPKNRPPDHKGQRPPTPPKPSPAVKPPNHAPADQATLEEIDRLAKQAGVQPDTLDYCFQAYGTFATSQVAAKEILEVLSREDASNDKVKAQTQRVISRRAAAEIKNQPG